MKVIRVLKFDTLLYSGEYILTCSFDDDFVDPNTNVAIVFGSIILYNDSFWCIASIELFNKRVASLVYLCNHFLVAARPNNEQLSLLNDN